MKYSTRQLYASYPEIDGQIVTVCGWIRTLRDSKNIAFIDLNDGFFRGVQIVLDGTMTNHSDITRLNIGSALTVTGVLHITPDAKQPFDIIAQSVTIEGECDSDFPLQRKQRSTMEFLREIPELRCRTNTFNAVFRIRSVAAFAIHQFFQELGFVYVNTPIITSSDCEGAGAMFSVTTLDLDKVASKDKVDYTKDFFGKKVGLTVSGQLQEECFTHAFGNTYTFGPTFRAENSNTARHAAEFWMMEPEMCFADLSDVLANEEQMVKYVIRYVLAHCKDEMEFLDKFVDTSLLSRLGNVLDNDFAVLTYTDAIDMLTKVQDRFEFPVYWGVDLQSEHERYITEEVYKKPVFLINYPKEIKSFYMRVNADGKTVAAADLLVPGIGELIGGSQREERYDVLMARLAEVGLDADDYRYYTDIRRYGTTKHGGYGLGFERLIMYITGMSNIRDVSLIPRTVGSIKY